MKVFMLYASVFFQALICIQAGHYDTYYMDEKIPRPHKYAGVHKQWKDTLYFKPGVAGSSAPNSNGTNFLVVGDWGGSITKPFYTQIELHVSTQMARVARANAPQFILALGDNFYTEGVKSIDDPRFKETFEDVYTDSSLQVPWYLVAGNHDHYGNVSAQIAYSKVSKRWNFPDYSYFLNFTFNGGKTMAGIVMIDTINLCGSPCDYGDRIKPSAKSEMNWKWLEQQLMRFNQTGVKYLFVGGHFPAYSIAEHGGCPCLTQRLPALMKRYQVTAYLSGHEHNLQHIQVDNLNYFVIGAGNYNCDSVVHKNTIPAGALKFHWAVKQQFGGFGLFQVRAENMTLNFFNGLGSQLYSYTMFPRKQ